MCLKNALVKVKVLFQLLYSSKAKKKKEKKSRIVDYIVSGKLCLYI